MSDIKAPPRVTPIWPHQETYARVGAWYRLYRAHAGLARPEPLAAQCVFADDKLRVAHVFLEGEGRVEIMYEDLVMCDMPGSRRTVNP